MRSEKQGRWLENDKYNMKCVLFKHDTLGHVLDGSSSRYSYSGMGHLLSPLKQLLPFNSFML